MFTTEDRELTKRRLLLNAFGNAQATLISAWESGNDAAVFQALGFLRGLYMEAIGFQEPKPAAPDACVL